MGHKLKILLILFWPLILIRLPFKLVQHQNIKLIVLSKAKFLCYHNQIISDNAPTDKLYQLLVGSYLRTNLISEKISKKLYSVISPLYTWIIHIKTPSRIIELIELNWIFRFGLILLFNFRMFCSSILLKLKSTTFLYLASRKNKIKMKILTQAKCIIVCKPDSF